MTGNALGSRFGVLLLDLDGTLYLGHEPIASAVEALASVEQQLLYVTNNASRAVSDVAASLRSMGYTATSDDVVSSGQAAARILAAKLAPGSRVLVVGTEAFVAQIAEAGLTPVRTNDRVVAVAQGHNTETAWPILAEAAYAIGEGAMWVAANADGSLPTTRGFAPGNGAMVAALSAATGAEPIVAGKPYPPLTRDALARYRGDGAALVVGDRLDTDIEGANALGLASLLVMTGVCTTDALLHAIPARRPTFVGLTLGVLNAPAEASEIGPKPGCSAEVVDGELEVRLDAALDAQTALAATAYAAWSADEEFTSVVGADAHSAGIVDQWPA